MGDPGAARQGTYCVIPIFGSLEVHHAVQTREGRAVTLTSMRFEFLLGEDIAAGLYGGKGKISISMSNSFPLAHKQGGERYWKTARTREREGRRQRERETCARQGERLASH